MGHPVTFLADRMPDKGVDRPSEPRFKLSGVVKKALTRNNKKRETTHPSARQVCVQVHPSTSLIRH
ncbi:MAG: hypothetical protein NVSMB33_07160 [Ktedonobacteraceae bacterium]